MSKSTTAAFVATVAIAVPAGWHIVDADWRADGKHVRPLQQTVEIDGAKVTLEVDHNLIAAGDKVTATLVATSDTPRSITVDLTTYGQGWVPPESRVEPPPIAIDHEKITLHAGPGGGTPVRTAVALGTRGGEHGEMSQFKMLVTKPGVKLTINNDVSSMAEAGEAAAVGVLAWSGNQLGIEMVAEGPVTHDDTFTIAIHVKNTSRKPMRHMSMQLGTQIGRYGYIDSADESGFAIESIDDAAHDETYWDQTIPPGGEEVSRFRVTPTEAAKALTQVTLVAAGFESPIGMRAGRGALDAHTFTFAPSEVATK